MKPYLLAAMIGVCSLDALAQQQTSADPKVTDPAAHVPQVTYRSAFDNYVPYREQAIAPWREVNEEVARVGGHTGIFRGAGHGMHGQSAPAKPPAGEPASGATEAGGQPPVRGAPKPPAGDRPQGN
jgi:hypothetical protein